MAWAHQGRRAPERCGSGLSSRTTPRSQRDEGGDPRPVTSPVPSLAWYSRWLHDHRLRAIQTPTQDVGLRPEQSWREKKTADSGRRDPDSVCGEPGGDAASLSVRPPGAFQTGQSAAACGEGAGLRGAPAQSARALVALATRGKQPLRRRVAREKNPKRGNPGHSVLT